jgi:long-subunit acyl-CoA synthetase (AMP-forming)
MQIGTEVEDKVLDKRQKGMAINQCATLVYTSGTTGMPKGNNKLIEMLMFFGSSNFY